MKQIWDLIESISEGFYLLLSFLHATAAMIHSTILPSVIKLFHTATEVQARNESKYGPGEIIKNKEKQSYYSCM